jgi:hypothetical protein
MRDLFAPQNRALSGFGGFYPLRPISEEDWQKGLRERFQADGCEIAEDALARIVELGELHPRVTMLISQQTHFLSVLLDRVAIDRTLVEQGDDSAYQRDSALLDQLVEQIRFSHRQALRIARRVAAHSRHAPRRRQPGAEKARGGGIDRTPRKRRLSHRQPAAPPAAGSGAAD